MRRAHALALLVAVALAGCPAATSDPGTVTPAPVPDQPSPGTTPTSLPCDVPTAEPPPESTSTSAATETDRSSPASGTTTATASDGASTATSRGGGPTATPQSETPSVPVEDGTVNATALVERHDRLLRDQRYQLSAPGLFVQADPTGPALRVRAESSLTAVRHYVVDGTRYTYASREGGQQRYEVHPYDDDGFRRGFGSVYSLTGSDWLADVLAVAPHRVADRRANGWTVLRADDGDLNRDAVGPASDDESSVATGEASDSPTDESSPERTTPIVDEDESIHALDSTVLVDERGIVRTVEQRFEVREDDGAVRTVNRTLSVTDVGTATVERPEWVCIAERNGHLEVP